MREGAQGVKHPQDADSLETSRTPCGSKALHSERTTACPPKIVLPVMLVSAVAIVFLVTMCLVQVTE
jgi:hypothetical protein